MQNQNWCRLDYVDAFAGRGKQTLKSGSILSEAEEFFGGPSEREDTEDFLIGSALRALRTEKDGIRCFDRYLFVDTDKTCLEQLETHVRQEYQYANHKVNFICGNANSKLREYVRGIDWEKTRALVFLDPYGLEVGWNLIKELADTRACDVWYLFPLGGVTRLMANDGQIPDAWATRLDQLFGTGGWRQEFYRPSAQRSLFSEDKATFLKDAPTKRIVEYIRDRLATVFAAVSDIGVLRNSKGAPLFALLLGVSNPSRAATEKALRIANHLVKGLNQP